MERQVFEWHLLVFHFLLKIHDIFLKNHFSHSELFSRFQLFFPLKFLDIERFDMVDRVFLVYKEKNFRKVLRESFATHF